ncbi:MAG: hypothetical protein O3C17_17145 [Planctomycetota bacterium]|nr:hypothetical protein [Planctomycetota bacterium]
MTSAELLAQLQAAWQSAPVSENHSPQPTRTRCLAHLDCDVWMTEPVPDRPGWVKTTCRLCGTFIGFRPES